MLHQVSLRKHYLLIKQNLLYIICCLLAIIFALLSRSEASNLYFKILASVAIIFLSPTVILHYTYYMQAKDMQIEFTAEGMKVYKEYKLIKTIKDEDIISIELYLSPSCADIGTSSGRIPMEEYYYAIIITHSGDTIINNLLYPDLLNVDRYLNLSKFKYNTTILPFLP